MILTLSSLPHTWILDLDGTLVEHNGYKKYGYDVLLDGAREFLSSIPSEDMIIILTSRKKDYQEITETFLKDNNIRYDHIIYEAPYGERILINDDKPSGLRTSYGINITRDTPLEFYIKVVETL